MFPLGGNSGAFEIAGSRTHSGARSPFVADAATQKAVVSKMVSAYICEIVLKQPPSISHTPSKTLPNDKPTAEHVNTSQNANKIKRAITLAGHGPAAGWHIGVLAYLKSVGIEFDVWALSGIGAWVGVVYNQADEGNEVEQTTDFFRNQIFRDDESYRSFPTNRIFVPDWAGNVKAFEDFLSELSNYGALYLPRKLFQSLVNTLSLLYDKKQKWSEADLTRWLNSDVLENNPLIRLLTSMMWNSNIDGIYRLFYRDGGFLKKINFSRLNEKGKPFIFFNA
jgi:predicted acylesterase/phospholipase RssA